MGPGQLHVNDLESAILTRIAADSPAVRHACERLRVLSRKYTGVGCYIEFMRDAVCDESTREQFGLNAMINVPGVPNGMGALLFCLGGAPEFLEIYTFGDEHWDGQFDGFSIADIASH